MHTFNLKTNNIITCEDFLPQKEIDFIYMDLLNLRKFFEEESWEYSEGNKTNLPIRNCGGKGLVINDKEEEKRSKCPHIFNLKERFFSPGIMFFIDSMKNNTIFNLLPISRLKWHIHIVSYSNGGYYDWHQDTGNDTLFTFNLVLSKSPSMKGGDFLFNDEKIIKIENRHNSLCIFPSYIPHAVTKITIDEEKSTSFLEQRFSIQYWVKLNNVQN